MDTHTSLEEALMLALKLAPKERLQLIEQIAASVEHEIETTPSAETQPEEHWGKLLNRLMDEIGPIEMLYPEIEDPVEWVKHLRAEQRRRRLSEWSETDHADDSQ